VRTVDTLWRFRFPVDRWGYELPGGLVERDETAAARETIEETSWRPLGTPEHLVRFEPLPGPHRALDALVADGNDRVPAGDSDVHLFGQRHQLRLITRVVVSRETE
jgi:8-oxo-dGTP pyrophosphatase MutT (NUDIX family)